MSLDSLPEIKNFQCEKCSEKFVKKYNLTRHMVRKHPESPKSTIQQNNHNPQQNSRNPQQNNHNEPPYHSGKCPQCEKVFIANWRLLRHIEKCKGEKNRFECEHCLKQFTHERSRFRHYKICTKPPTIINNNTTNINAETYIENQTNNNYNILVFGEQPFITDHLTKEHWKKIVENIDSRAMTEYSKYILLNVKNRCVKKTNIKLNHSQIHVGDDKWELQLDSIVYPKLAYDMANDMSEYIHTKRDKLRREVFEKLRDFVDYMADNGYINTEDLDRKKIIQAEYKKFVNGLKLIVYDTSK